MLKATDVAHQLGISSRAVYDLAASGHLACYRVGVGGGAVRFDQADVDTYKASQTRRAKQPTGRELRVYETLRKAAAGTPEGDAIPRLSPEQLAMAEKRVRRMRRAPWASAEAIADMYRQAKTLSAQTGVPHHVDHVIPLLGEFVSGLHVETNLQILPAAENIQKRNRFEAP